MPVRAVSAAPAIEVPSSAPRRPPDLIPDPVALAVAYDDSMLLRDQLVRAIADASNRRPTSVAPGADPPRVAPEPVREDRSVKLELKGTLDAYGGVQSWTATARVTSGPFSSSIGYGSGGLEVGGVRIPPKL